jgi:hypothetical protein
MLGGRKEFGLVLPRLGFRSALAHSAVRKNELGAIDHRARTARIAALPVTVVALAKGSRPHILDAPTLTIVLTVMPARNRNPDV